MEHNGQLFGYMGMNWFIMKLIPGMVAPVASDTPIGNPNPICGSKVNMRFRFSLVTPGRPQGVSLLRDNPPLRFQAVTPPPHAPPPAPLPHPLPFVLLIHVCLRKLSFSLLLTFLL